MTNYYECTSSRHVEIDCLNGYYAKGKRFTAEQWCERCQERYADTISTGRYSK